MKCKTVRCEAVVAEGHTFCEDHECAWEECLKRAGLYGLCRAHQNEVGRYEQAQEIKAERAMERSLEDW